MVECRLSKPDVEGSNPFTRFSPLVVHSFLMTNVTGNSARPLARCWWLKRLTLAAVVGLVILACAWLVLDRYLAHKMQSRLDAYQRQGQATSVEDLQPPAVADDDNAAYFYKQAAAAMPTRRSDRIAFAGNVSLACALRFC